MRVLRLPRTPTPLISEVRLSSCNKLLQTLLFLCFNTLTFLILFSWNDFVIFLNASPPPSSIDSVTSLLLESSHLAFLTLGLLTSESESLFGSESSSLLLEPAPGFPCLGNTGRSMDL